MTWSWTLVIPETMLAVGAILLLAAFPLQWITPENSKLALWFALVGGFGVGGGTGGWLGRLLAQATFGVASATERLTAQLVGASFTLLVFAVVGIVFWKKAGPKGKGFESKGDKKKDKFKQMVGLLVFAMLGTAISAIPMLYTWANTGVSAAANILISVLP